MLLKYQFSFNEAYATITIKGINCLTPREQQCLNLTAQHYLAKDIANLLSITERTVHYHLQNANKKLGTKNKYQSVLKMEKF